MASIEEHISVNGARLRVRIEGPEDAPVIAMAHSLGTDLRLWDPQVDDFSKRYRLLRYDARGHGKSDPPAGSVSIDILADDLLGLLAYYGIKQAYLVGLSFGALTLLAAAVRNDTAVKGIVVCNTTADTPEEAIGRLDQQITALRAAGMQAIVEGRTASWLSAAATRERPELVDKVSTMLLTTSPQGYIACAEAIQSTSLMTRIKAISVPSLFIGTDADPIVPAGEVQKMAQQVAGARLATIRGGGHLVNLEQPEAFNALVLEFIDNLSK